MNYPKAISTIRNLRNLSQKQLAEKIGKTPGYISKIESGNRVPTTEVIEDVCRELEIPYYLFALLASDAEDIHNLPQGEVDTLTTGLLNILVNSNGNNHTGNLSNSVAQSS